MRAPFPAAPSRFPRWARAAVAVAALALVPAALRAQRGTVDPGMTRAQVEERLGKPKAERTTGNSTFLFYANGCVRECGMDDLVVLENDAVVDAIFRSPAHRYTGTSSSPAPLTPSAARAQRGAPSGTLVVSSDSGAAPRRGSFVAGGPPPGADSAATKARSTRRPRARRPAARRAGTSAPPLAATPRGTIVPAGAAPSAPPVVDSARTGIRTTTGPVDAGAAVQNTGSRPYPAATPVPSSRAPGADSLAGTGAARVPFQGSKLAPADSAAAANRPPQTVPGQTAPAPQPRPPASP